MDLNALALEWAKLRHNPQGTKAKRVHRPEKGWRIIDILGVPQRSS